MLTIGLDLMECCGDSYGHLGDVINEAVLVYAGTDRGAAGLAPEVFWPDFLEILTLLSNYGIPTGSAAELFERAGAGDVTVARMKWHTGSIRALHAYALVGAGAVDRFEATAAQLDSTNRIALNAMVQAARELGRPELAQRTLDAAARNG